MDVGEKQGGSLKKIIKKLLVEQCKPCLKAQPATHAVQPVLWFRSQQRALLWQPALHVPSSLPRTQPSCRCHGRMGDVLLLHKLPLNWLVLCFLPHFHLLQLRLYPSTQMTLLPRVPHRSCKSCEKICPLFFLLFIPQKLYYNTVLHEKLHFWRWLLSHHAPLCFLTLKQVK